MVSSNNVASWRRIGGVAGIVFGLGLFIILFTFGDQPLATDPIEDIRSYAVDDANSVFLFNWFAVALFVFAFLIFASALRSVLAGTDDDDSGMWARVSFAAAVATVAVSGAGSAFTSALALRVDDYSDSTIRALMNLDATLYATVAPWGFALFLTAASIVILRSGVLWKWLGWFGLVVALGMVIGTFWVFDGDEEGFLAILVWIGITATLLWSLLTGVAMIRQEGGR